MNSKPLTQFTIYDYPDRVILSNSAPAVYFELGKATPKVPKKYHDARRYAYKSHIVGKGKYARQVTLLSDIVTGSPVIANPGKVGKPKYWKINFQDIWNGYIARKKRAKVARELKALLRPHVLTLDKMQGYPVASAILIYDINTNMDVDNMGVVYHKVLNDLLVEHKIILDDSARYLNDTGRTKFIYINTEDERKLIFRIYKSDNEDIDHGL